MSAMRAAVWRTAMIGAPGLTVAASIGLAIATVGLLAIPRLSFAIHAPHLDAAQTTLAALVTGAVAVLCYARFREHGDAGSLIEAAAFTLVSLTNLAVLAAMLFSVDRDLGIAVEAPTELPVVVWAVVHLVSAGLLCVAALRPSWIGRLVRRSRTVLILPSIGTALVVVGMLLLHDRLPALVDPATLRSLTQEPFSARFGGPLGVPLLVFVGAAGVLLAVAAVGYSRRPADEAIPRPYLVIGLVFAVFAEVHFILYPAPYGGLVTTADALRLAFYLILAAGIEATTRRDIRALRLANDRLRVLSTAEADRTAMAERTRLARELHDGLAQDLWTANLELRHAKGTLAAANSDVEEVLAPLQVALDAALHEARAAVTSLRSGFDAGLTLADELPRRLDEFAERTGYLIDLDLDPMFARLTGVRAAEIIRIVEEALTNIHRHADATRISVRAIRRDGEMVVSVEDNGRGFDPSVTRAGHGLTGMRERAVLLGGRLVVRSAPGDGASVQLGLPFAAID